MQAMWGSVKLPLFPRIITGGDYYFFSHKKGPGWLFEGRRLFNGGDYFKYCIAHWKSCPLSHWNIMTTYELFKCYKFGSLINFQCQYFRRQLELSLISFAGSDSTLTWQGGDKRKRRRQEGQGGDYSREAITVFTRISAQPRISAHLE